ncbi:MAG: DoxX family protein [Thermoleophilaceae bacterium]|nr:DoxX family protein [Thermoleophilaceae bacterium]
MSALPDTTFSQRALAAVFSFAGVMHFVIPRTYEAIMPPYLPAHHELVLISGIAEIVGGLAVIPPSTRSFARWWLIALLIAVFPANLHLAINPGDVKGFDPDRIPEWLLWARLPGQLLFIYWVWRATRPRPA